MCDGTCLQDLEILRNDENFLAALGARRISIPPRLAISVARFSPRRNSIP